MKYFVEITHSMACKNKLQEEFFEWADSQVDRTLTNDSETVFEMIKEKVRELSAKYSRCKSLEIDRDRLIGYSGIKNSIKLNVSGFITIQLKEIQHEFTIDENKIPLKLPWDAVGLKVYPINEFAFPEGDWIADETPEQSNLQDQS